MALTINRDLRRSACTALAGKWTPAVLTTLVYILLACVCSYIPFLKFPASLLVLPVLGFGFQIIFLNVMRAGTEPQINALFSGFNNYGKTLGTMLLAAIYTWLWSLLLLIPGIIKSYSYAMTPFILNDEPELGADEVICKSMAMMRGHKMKLFLLDLSFIGWVLLAVLTLGIGFLWLAPWMENSRAAFYLDLKREAQQGA
ncbi:DUF975 family protein [uncultured Rikenella sp.]|uniref:DUF975 family protein n=1 Tax=uncultured Rikenella sp. TaxID=368003 RepID=UPI0025FB5518|nr:DUF975 family protein [uncultured Rikenella sp.]